MKFLEGGDELEHQYYIQQLYDCINKQQEEIIQLQARLAHMANEIEDLKNSPHINVEKLEYKFDQLKIETLEGTLNIGINPSDLQKIEDLAVPPPPIPKNKNTMTDIRDTLANKLNQYIEEDLKNFIYETEKQVGVQHTQEQIIMIQDDIRKQLPARTNHYIQFFNNQDKEQLPEEKLIEKLYKTMTLDMNQAVRTFIIQSHNHGKGETNDRT